MMKTLLQPTPYPSNLDEGALIFHPQPSHVGGLNRALIHQQDQLTHGTNNNK
uniref:Uncharacterized protein n=1 Tax=Arundo donax TaxID=35708 RepID=A0A0A8YRE2_ARUDO